MCIRDRVRVERRTYQFLYKDDTGYSFMDTETFEQISLQETTIDAPQYLKEGQEVGILINTENDIVLSLIHISEPTRPY